MQPETLIKSAMEHGGERDRISALPDELLHAILCHLDSAHAAARTSVLSRRWRPVWTTLPDLVLAHNFNAWAPLDSVDAALAACSAPTLNLLDITVFYQGPRVPACRAAPWLHFASRRLAGKLRLALNRENVAAREEEEDDDEDDQVLELPLLDRPKEISIILDESVLLRLPAGTFTMLTGLEVSRARMEGRALEAAVSSQCPCLRSLELDEVILLGVPDLSIRSDSLEQLWISIRNARRLNIAGPRLQKLGTDVETYGELEVHIAAPKLAEVCWHGHFNPDLHQIAQAGRHLRRLELELMSRSQASLIQRFDDVNELRITVFLPPGIPEYKSILEDMKQLPKCEALSVTFLPSTHDITPSMFHLLKERDGLRKLLVHLDSWARPYPCMLVGCPCRSPEGNSADDIALDSLEEVNISEFRGADDQMELAKLLFKQKPLKRVTIHTPIFDFVLNKEMVCEKIRAIIVHPGTNIVFNARRGLIRVISA